MLTEKQKQYHKIYRQKHKQKRSEYARLWRIKNRVFDLARKRKYRQENKEKIALHDKIYRQTHKEQRNRWSGDYGYAYRHAKGKHTKEEWERLKQEFGNKCLCCGKSEPEVKLSNSIGGTNSLDNLQLLCVSCNSSKKSNMIDYRPKICQ